MSTTQASTTGDDLGRLRALGPREPWQCALLLPLRFDDLTRPRTRFAPPEEGVALHLLTAVGVPSSRYDGAGPRVAVMVEDAQGARMRAVIYGPPRDTLPLVRQGHPIALMGQARPLGDGFMFGVTQVIAQHDVGTLRPAYAGKPKVIGAARVRELVQAHLPRAIPVAATFLEEELRPIAPIALILAALGCRGWTMQQILAQAHQPRDARYADHAMSALDRIAALIALARAERCRPRAGQHRAWQLPTIAQRMAALPFALTQDQRAAITRIVRGLDGLRPLRALLSGDVGTGKSAVFAVVAAAMADAGARVAILLPNEVLVTQVADVVSQFFPDVPVCAVTGETTRNRDLKRYAILVGTTTLMHRDAGPFDLVVIDEQQKFGVAARSALLGQATHLLECSATCIPRTLALARYGVIDVMELRKGPKAKEIHTRIQQAHQARELFAQVQRTIAQGDQVLVIYPLADEQGASAARSVEAAGKRWEERFPGRVRTLTGGDDGATKAAVLQDMRADRAAVLVATTVVEVGVDLPRLRHVVVVHPERFGLSVLHQIRGRAARQGGHGRCDLFAPSPLAQPARERLEVLVGTQDGFEVAARDLALRGFGDLSPGATSQSGGDESVLFGRPVTPAAVEGVLAIWERFAPGCVEKYLGDQ